MSSRRIDTPLRGNDFGDQLECCSAVHPPHDLWLTGGKRKVVVSVGELEVPKGKRNRQLVKDYRSWFWNYR